MKDSGDSTRALLPLRHFQTGNLIPNFPATIGDLHHLTRISFSSHPFVLYLTSPNKYQFPSLCRSWQILACLSLRVLVLYWWTFAKRFLRSGPEACPGRLLEGEDRSSSRRLQKIGITNYEKYGHLSRALDDRDVDEASRRITIVMDFITRASTARVRTGMAA